MQVQFIFINQTKKSGINKNHRPIQDKILLSLLDLGFSGCSAQERGIVPPKFYFRNHLTIEDPPCILYPIIFPGIKNFWALNADLNFSRNHSIRRRTARFQSHLSYIF